MSFFDSGNPPINSTFAPVNSATSTGTLVAELDSTQLGSAFFRTGQSKLFGVTAVLGASTGGIFQVELANSTALASPIETAYIQMGQSGQSGQYFLKFDVPKDGRIRARLTSTFAGTATAFLSAEVLT